MVDLPIKKKTLKILWRKKKHLHLQTQNRDGLLSECSAVGSALRSGRRGRAFESPHSDRKRRLEQFSLRFCYIIVNI